MFASATSVDALIEGVTEALESEIGHQIQGRIDPQRLLTKKELAQTPGAGVFNACVLYAAATSDFNRQLLGDLEQMQDSTGLGETALRLLIEEGSAGDREAFVPVLPFHSNEYQLEAMRKVLADDLTVVTGPPGTGKSELVANILVNLVVAGKTALLVSNTNEAVKVVHERLEGLFPGILLRTGNKEARQSLRGQLDEAMAKLGRSSRPLRKDAMAVRWQRIIELRWRLQRWRDMQELYASLDDDIDQGARFLGTDRKRLVQVLSKSEPAARIQTYFELWKIAEARSTGHGIGLVDRLLSKLFPERLAGRAKRAASKVVNTIGPEGLDIAFGTRQPSLTGRFDAQAIGDYLRVLAAFEQQSDTVAELDASVGSVRIEEQISFEQDAFCDLSRVAVGESYLSKLKSSQQGLLRAFIQQVVDRRPSRDVVRPQMATAVLAGLPLWTSTLKSLASTFPLSPALFDYVIFDEASQVDLPSAAPALYRANRAVVVGDPMQLSHVASLTPQRDETIARQFNVDRWTSLYPGRVRYSDVSLYRAAERVPGSEPIMLRQHYRSQDAIADLCNRVFYDGQLDIRTDLTKRRLPTGITWGVTWHHVAGTASKHPAGSRYNVAEAEAAVELLCRLVEAAKGSDLTIGVVTPFSRQERILQEAVTKRLTPAQIEQHQIKVLTAHKFQGREADVMVASLVVSGRGDGSDDRWFNNYPQILNVALSRARNSLYIVGDREHALQHRCRPNCYLERVVRACSVQLESRRAAYFDTPLEQSLWRQLTAERLEGLGYELHSQLVVERYTLDLALTGPTKIDIECDGLQHQSIGGTPVLSDLSRDRFLASRGWTVLRFPNHRIRSEPQVIVEEIVREAARHRGL